MQASCAKGYYGHWQAAANPPQLDRQPLAFWGYSEKSRDVKFTFRHCTLPYGLPSRSPTGPHALTVCHTAGPNDSSPVTAAQSDGSWKGIRSKNKKVVGDVEVMLSKGRLPGSYFGPVFISTAPDIGRCLEAKGSLVTGDLLFISNALAIVHDDLEIDVPSILKSNENDGSTGEVEEQGQVDVPTEGSAEASSQRQDPEGPETVEQDVEGGDDEEEEGEDEGEDDAVDEYAEILQQLQDRVLEQLPESENLKTAMGWLYNGQPESRFRMVTLPSMAGRTAPRADRLGLARGPPPVLTVEQVCSAVALNSPLPEIEDLLLCSAVGTNPRLVCGLWPEAALLNHSCLPNVGLVAAPGGRLIARASRGVPKSGMLVANWLGDGVFAPLAARREELAARHGVPRCGCERCAAEEGVPSALAVLVTQLAFGATNTLAPALECALLEDDEEKLESLRQQLIAYVETVGDALDRQGLAPQLRFWVQAGLLPLYGLLAECLEALDSTDLTLLSLCEALAAEVAPGSDTHLRWARALRSEAAAEAGSEGEAFRSADKRCYRAHIARYGGMSKLTYAELLRRRQQLEEQLGVPQDEPEGQDKGGEEDEEEEGEEGAEEEGEEEGEDNEQAKMQKRGLSASQRGAGGEQADTSIQMTQSGRGGVWNGRDGKLSRDGSNVAYDSSGKGSEGDSRGVEGLRGGGRATRRGQGH